MKYPSINRIAILDLNIKTKKIALMMSTTAKNVTILTLILKIQAIIVLKVIQRLVLTKF